ncbi:hypothetical protein HYZ97_02220 [Candidatus Pacearchaeota archaeon]|nr:hypothetical protein [Candidatus Pacearchaeota archaeon]
MTSELLLKDNENLNIADCKHSFTAQGNVSIGGIIWDIYYCSKCLLHVKKERPCPLHLKEKN